MMGSSDLRLVKGGCSISHQCRQADSKLYRFPFETEQIIR